MEFSCLYPRKNGLTLENYSMYGPGQVDQLVGTSSLYANVAGLMSNQGTYRSQPMIHKQEEHEINVSFSPILSLSKVNLKIKCKRENLHDDFSGCENNSTKFNTYS